MKIGMHLPVMVPGFDRDVILEWSRRIDAGPFSSLASGERITFPNPDITVALAAAAAVTERVRLHYSVLVLPMHRTLLVAKQVATLDVVSGGRVTLGVGVGGREEDYRAVEADFGGRGARMAQQVALLRRAWAGESVVKEALRPVEPAPIQPGGPEILAGSLLPRSVRRAASFADGLCDFSFGPSKEEIGNRYELARRAWKEAGRASPPRLVGGFWFALGDGARDQMDSYLGRYLNFMGETTATQVAKDVRSVSAPSLRDSLAMLEDLGADEVLLTPTTLDPDEIDRVADLIG
jgi:alkanesulfonate monooxygenase SsuD/methylene tetrahydromethanopterin reductase-like flavin-dependent oxidoreductase (luciferase family)